MRYCDPVIDVEGSKETHTFVGGNRIALPLSGFPVQRAVVCEGSHGGGGRIGLRYGLRSGLRYHGEKQEDRGRESIVCGYWRKPD